MNLLPSSHQSFRSRVSVRIFLSFILSILMLSCVSTAQAQEASISGNLSDVPSLKEEYKRDLNIYRDDDRLFGIAKEQDRKLDTTTSLEEAVRATQKAMSSRAVVLKKYLTIVRIILNETPGIDLQMKHTQLSGLDSVLDGVKKHQQLIETTSDRTRVLSTAQEYVTLYPKITTNAYRSLSLIAYGNMQSVYDKTIAVTQELKTHIEEREKNPLKLAEKRRAFDEIDRTLNSTGQKLKNIRAQIEDKRSSSRDEYSAGQYNSVVDGLNKVYADISRSISYLKEVNKE